MPALFDDLHVVHLCPAGATDSTGLVRILGDAQDTEALSDRLARASHLGWRKDFRLVMLAVEATLPRVEAPPAREQDAAATGASGKTTPRRIGREELYEDLAQASRLTTVYLVMVALAAVGLIRGDVALIIGAMVIGPSLACTLGDLDLARRPID